MDLLGLQLTINEVLAILSLIGVAVAGWFKLKNDVQVGNREIEKFHGRMMYLEGKVGEHEKQVSVANVQLSSIQTQVTYISTKLDTLLTYLLEKRKEDK